MGSCASVACESAKVVPTCYRISMPRNTDAEFEVIITDGGGRAFDITLDTIVLTISEQLAGSPIIQKSNGPGSHLEPTKGRTLFEIDRTEIDDETSETAKTFWVFEIRRILSTGEQRVHIQGEFVVVPTVTA